MNHIDVYRFKLLIITFYLWQERPHLCACLGQFGFSSPDSKWHRRAKEIPVIESGRPQSHAERRHIHMLVTTMFPDTLHRKGMAM